MTGESKPIRVLSEPVFLWDLSFLTDLTEHLSLRLSGNDKLVHDYFLISKHFKEN